MKELIQKQNRALTAAEFQGLSDVPPEIEWFANIGNEKTRRAYQHDVKDFSQFLGLENTTEIRQVTRAHLIVWRKQLENRALAPASILQRS